MRRFRQAIATPSRTRVSDYFQLGRSQPELDFVDVDIWGDIVVFFDPRALRLLPSPWAADCRSLLQNFFHCVLNAIRTGDHKRAQDLLCCLGEPNETHLGFSRQRARGHALGPGSAIDVSEALSRSEAVKSGLLEDLEDSILMVERIGPDIVSDITTNVIREPLIHYTQVACRTYGIPTTLGVASGRLWDPSHQDWTQEFTELPTTPTGRLLLVPKSLIRVRTDYDTDEYYRWYLLEYLREAELDANTELVHLLKNGKRNVYIKDLEDKYGKGKLAVVRLTRDHPEILQAYREDKKDIVSPPLDHTQNRRDYRWRLARLGFPLAECP